MNNCEWQVIDRNKDHHGLCFRRCVLGIGCPSVIGKIFSGPPQATVVKGGISSVAVILDRLRLRDLEDSITEKIEYLHADHDDPSKAQYERL